MKPWRTLLLAVALSPVVLSAGPPQDRDRSKTPDQYKWNLTDLAVRSHDAGDEPDDGRSGAAAGAPISAPVASVAVLMQA